MLWFHLRLSVFICGYYLPERLSMRKLKIAAAQLGPLHLADTRSTATKRLVKLLRDAHGMGAKFVVFPELAFTAFEPLYRICTSTILQLFVLPCPQSPKEYRSLVIHLAILPFSNVTRFVLSCRKSVGSFQSKIMM